MWHEITYSFPNYNGATVEVWEWTNNFIPHFRMDVITYPVVILGTHEKPHVPISQACHWSLYINQAESTLANSSCLSQQQSWLIIQTASPKPRMKGVLEPSIIHSHLLLDYVWLIGLYLNTSQKVKSVYVNFRSFVHISWIHVYCVSI